MAAGWFQIPIGSDPNGSDPDGSDPNGSDPDGSDPNGSDPDGSEPNGSDPNGSDPNGSDPDGSEPNGSDPNGSDPDGSDPDGSDPDGSDPNGSDPDAWLTQREGTSAARPHQRLCRCETCWAGRPRRSILLPEPVAYCRHGIRVGHTRLDASTPPRFPTNPHTIVPP